MFGYKFRQIETVCAPLLQAIFEENLLETVSLRGKKILVVGGNGFVGRHVVHGFLAQGCDVQILDITPPPKEFEHLVSFVGDVSDISMLAAATHSADTVVFLANSSLPGSANTDLAGEVRAHVERSVKAAEICAAQSVRRFLFASSGGTVYGYSSEQSLTEMDLTQPKNAYGVSKLTIENYLRLIAANTQMQTVCLRISNPYGEGQRAVRGQGFIAAAMQHAVAGTQMALWGDGSVERDFIHISDVANAFLAAATVEDAPLVVNIGSAEARSLRDVVQSIEQILECNIDVAYEPGRTIDVKRNVLDISLAAQKLDWRPSISFDQGLIQTANWWIKAAR